MLRNDNIRMMAGGEVESQPSKPIRLLSLFSGIGAFEKALDRENIPYELAYFCEIDKFAVKSYCAVHGVSEDKNLGDISKIASEDIPDCDIVTYGYPCQDISVAGKMAGIVEGETRSGLLFEALHIIKNKKPKYAIAENVKNLVGKKFKADFDNMLNILDSYGYNSYWKVLNAKDYGIPQNRERVFVISIRKDIDDGTFKFPEKFPLELRLKDMLEETVDEKFYLTPKQIDKFQNSRKKAQEILSNNPVPRLVGGIGEINFGKQYRLGNRVYDANEIAMCLTASPVGNAGGYSYLYKVSEADTPDYETIKPVSDNYAVLNGGKIGKMTDIYRRAYYDKGVSPTLHTCPGGNTEAKVIITDQQIIDSIPNTYNKKRAQELLIEKGYIPELHNPYHNTELKDISPTVTTYSGNSTNSGTVLYKHNFRIRKLTPKEYWRLMGFDDVDFEKAKSAGISNTQLYKQAGNSIVVNVLQYIFRNLFKCGFLP